MWDKILKAMNRKSPVQLVKHIDDVPVSVRTKNCQWPAYAQLKEDGVYCMVVKLGNEVRLFSRTGNEFYTECKQYWFDTQFHNLCDGVWISEMINSTISLEELSGAVNTNRVNRWEAKLYTHMYWHTRFKFHDYLTHDEFLRGSSQQPYSSRLLVVERYTSEYARPITQVVWHHEDWLVFVAEMIKVGNEGAVLKQMHAPWVAGHKGWHCMKEVRGIHVDLRCTGVVMGTGKFEGLIAGLKFEWKGKPFTAGLGKGWDDEFQKVQTMAFLQDEFNVVNQIWHVSALQESSKGVLRLPKVQEMRIDKDNSDDNH